MIITLKGADFSKNNIGPLSSWLISREIGDGARYSGPVYVSKGGAFSATVVLAEGYTLDSAGVTVIMGGSPVTSGVTVSGNTITISIASVTGNVVIKVPTKNISTGEEEEPVNYTFTINPNPTSATVTLSATGYSTVSGTGSKSITVADGTKVNWTVSASGYTTRTGNWTINGGNKTENIVLSATGGEGNTATYLLNKNIFSDGLITNNSGPGRLAIVEFFPTNGSALTVSSSITTNTIAIRYYKADKSTMASSASDSAYGRVVLVVGSTPLSDVYEGQTLTVNGTTYTLQNGAVSDVLVKYELGANINADGEVQSNYADAGRIAILHYFETHGTELTAAYSNAAYAESTGIAKRYYDGDKNGGATAATSTYGRLVLYNGTAESAIAENIEGTKITVNGVSYTLSNA